MENKVTDFDAMTPHWKSTDVIANLAEKYFDRRAELVRGILGADFLAYDGRKIKTVLCYVKRLNNGGIERGVSRVCPFWVEMGYHVIVLTNEEPKEEDYPLPKEGVERIVLKNHDCSTGKNYRARAKEWEEIIRKYKVDVVVYHPYARPEFLWDALVIKVNGAAVIGFWHAVFSVGFSNKWKWKNIINYLAPYELADALVVLSDTDRVFFKYYNGNIHVTINPLPENWQDWKCKRFTERHDILWPARLDSLKNPLDLISIMKEVLLEIPDAVLHVVGKSENGKLEEMLLTRIKAEGLEGHILLEGYSTDMKSWYLSSRIYLMTSDLEGYPNALTESKMAGLPCVMYELPYLTLCEGNRGIIPVPQRDTKAAAKAIIRLLKDDELCERYGKEARAHIEELAQFDFRKKWREIFESVEAGHKDTAATAEKRMMDMLIGEYMKESDRATKAEHENKELRDIRNGYSFRIGRAITWVPRKIRGGLKCFRKYGLVYICKRILEHFGIDMKTKDFS